MKHRVITVILLMIHTTFIFSNEKLYVTASGLFVRSKPHSQSLIINMIPFGTLVNVKKTRISERIGQNEASWYELEKPLNGFVYGAFLANEVTNTKQLVLCNETYVVMEFSFQTKLMLSKGYAIRIHYSLNSSIYSLDKGRYQIHSDGIQLVFSRTMEAYNIKANQKNSDGTSIDDWKSKIVRKEKTEKIYWIPTLKGFIEKHLLKFLKEHPLLKPNVTYTGFDTTSIYMCKSQSGYFTDRYWVNFNLPKVAKDFMNDGIW